MARFNEGVFAPFFAGGSSAPVVPSNGAVFYVDGANGSDNYGGTTPQFAFKTLDTAFNACAGGLNEIIYVLGGGTAVNYSSAIASGGSGLVWNKNYTHLIGLNSGPVLGQRSRVTNGATTVLYTPLLSVTGSGCLFQNIEFFNGGNHATSAAVCIAMSTGTRNVFVNCQISGGGHATSAGNAAMRSLTITGSGEHLFKHCYIGLTTEQRSTTSIEMELKTATLRNVFEDCYFASQQTVGGSGVGLISIAQTAIQDYVVFENCKFLCPSTFQGGSAIAQVMAVHAAPGGVVLVHNSISAGFTKFQTTASTAVQGDNPGSAAGGLGVAMTS